MKQKNNFLKTVCNLAIPVALQSMLQASFSIIDQIMIGQLGSVNIAGVGFAGKFSSIYSVVVSAIGAVAGIMISQYMGQQNKKEIRRSFYLNLILAIGLAVIFTLICAIFPYFIMGAYTKDELTKLYPVITLELSPQHFYRLPAQPYFLLCFVAWKKLSFHYLQVLHLPY